MEKKYEQLYEKKHLQRNEVHNHADWGLSPGANFRCHDDDSDDDDRDDDNHDDDMMTIYADHDDDDHDDDDHDGDDDDDDDMIAIPFAKNPPAHEIRHLRVLNERNLESICWRSALGCKRMVPVGSSALCHSPSKRISPSKSLRLK